MNINLKYFSGTGNSYKILDTCRKNFIQKGCNTTLSSITDNSKIDEAANLIGFCFPVYAFGIPRICRKYLQNLPEFLNPVNAFIIITAGEQEESGFSIPESMSILSRKGLEIIYSAVIQMPSNWTVSMNPPSKEEAKLGSIKNIIYSNGSVSAICGGILEQMKRVIHVNYVQKYARPKVFKL